MSQGFAAEVTESVFKKERKVVWAMLGLCHLSLHKVILGVCVRKTAQHHTASHACG